MHNETMSHIQEHNITLRYRMTQWPLRLYNIWIILIVYKSNTQKLNKHYAYTIFKKIQIIWGSPANISKTNEIHSEYEVYTYQEFCNNIQLQVLFIQLWEKKEIHDRWQYKYVACAQCIKKCELEYCSAMYLSSSAMRWLLYFQRWEL